MPAGLPEDAKECLLLRIAWLAALALALAGGSACNGVFSFSTCLDGVPPPRLTSLTPSSLQLELNPVVLTVNGSGFVAQSQILWNDNPLPTRFLDAQHLQTTVTQQILQSMGASPGNTVLISVQSQAQGALSGCVNGGTSGTLILIIN